MFGNFIFFILALLVYATYQPMETPRFSVGLTVFLLAMLVATFSLLAARFFRSISTALKSGTAPGVLGQRFDNGLKRYSIYALAAYIATIYGLTLPDFFRPIPLFQGFPTFEAIIFLALFIGYMTILWNAAYRSHQQLFPGATTRRDYISGQISFNLPVLLPWLALSTILDLLQLLPFDGFKRFLNTTPGQAIYFFVFLFFAAILAPAIVKVFWHCRPLPDGPDRRRIEALCRRTGVKFAGILNWPLFGGRMITAGVMGLVARFRYLLVTDALLEFLSPEEIDTVIAHELGHVKKRHLLFYLFFLGGYMLLSLSIFDLIIYFIIYSQPTTWLVETMGQDGTNTAAIIFAIATIVMFIVYFRYIFGFFMRNFERQADTYVYTLFNSAKPLISTLKKIAFASGQPINKPNWHHFSIGERIDYLERCEVNRRWVNRQDRKIKKGMTLFVIAMILVGVVGYQVNFGNFGRRLSHQFVEKILLEKIDNYPGRPEITRELAGLYYQWKKYSQAIEFYTRTLNMVPQDAESLNNLAWLYATCEDESLRNPEKALRLALRAVVEDPRAHVLDTLAESYFVNHQFQKAARTAQRASELAQSNKAYFQTQLKKFRDAAEAGL